MNSTDSAVQTALTSLRQGDPVGARSLLERAVTEGGSAGAWLLLAQVCSRLGDSDAEDKALDGALKVEPRFLPALLVKGERLAERGDDRAAVSFFNMALASAPSDLSPALAARIDRARAWLAGANDRFAAHLDAILAKRGVQKRGYPPRFVEAVDIMTGRAEVQLQQPTSFYYPGLPQTSFYNPDDFDWVAALQARTDEIRGELEQLLADETGFIPYVEGDPNRPNRGHVLLNDARWSAFHLLRNGAPVSQNADRCPKTMAALAEVPLAKVAGRAPMALFSLLRPHTHIPPHWGMLNTRLICHLPLIVPDKCRLRVGNHTRPVEAGRMMIFDDSINHEAWNDSDAVRVVLLFEIWRPELDAEERQALSAMFEAIGCYGEE